MQIWILFAIVTGALVMVGAGAILFALVRNVRTAQGPAMAGKYPQGHWMSVGMCIGIALGCIPALIGLFFDDMSSWVGIAPVIGLGLGIAIGSSLESKHKDELRPQTEEEQRVRFRLTLFGLGALAVFVVSLFVLGGMVLFTPK